MKVTLKTIISFFNAWAPDDLALKWDNVGLQIGDPNQEISEIIVALEVDEHVLAELKSKRNCLVITHHPLFFKPLSHIRYDYDMGHIIQSFVLGSHQLFSAHTNLDAALGGVNDCFIKLYGLDPTTGIHISEGFGKYFDNPNITLKTLVSTLPAKQVGSNCTRSISRLGFCAGAGKSLLTDVLELQIDTFVTGEVSYHDEVFARMNNIRLITVGHKESEDCIKYEIKSRLEKENLGIDIKTI